MAVDKRLLDDLARMTSGALGAAASLREEAESQFRERISEWLYRLDLVPREEFDALRAVAETARDEQEQLAARVAALEARLAALEGGTGKAKTTTAKTGTAKTGRTRKTTGKPAGDG